MRSLSKKHRPIGSGECATDTEGYTHLVIPDESRRTLKVRAQDADVAGRAKKLIRNTRTHPQRMSAVAAAAAAAAAVHRCVPHCRRLTLSFQAAQGRKNQRVTSAALAWPNATPSPNDCHAVSWVVDADSSAGVVRPLCAAVPQRPPPRRGDGILAVRVPRAGILR